MKVPAYRQGRRAFTPKEDDIIRAIHEAGGGIEEMRIVLRVHKGAIARRKRELGLPRKQWTRKS
jgi:hypothetical protein